MPDNGFNPDGVFSQCTESHAGDFLHSGLEVLVIDNEGLEKGRVQLYTFTRCDGHHSIREFVGIYTVVYIHNVVEGSEFIA